MRLLQILLPLLSLSLVHAQRFVRFISDDGREYTGDAILPKGSTDARFSTSAKVIEVRLGTCIAFSTCADVLCAQGGPSREIYYHELGQGGAGSTVY